MITFLFTLFKLVASSFWRKVADFMSKVADQFRWPSVLIETPVFSTTPQIPESAIGHSSSETQGQIVGARESLNGRKNMARRKVKNGEKSPWGQCLTRPVPNGRRRSAFLLGRKTQTFSGTNQKPERRRPFGTGLVRHCPRGSSCRLLLFFVPYFSNHLDFPSPPLSAPRSPRM